MTIPIKGAQIVVPCFNFEATFAALTTRLGFQVDVIFPADAPTTAVVSGFGVTLRLESTATSTASEEPVSPMVLRLMTDHPPEIVVVPDMRIDWARSASTLEIPDGKQEFIITRANAVDDWVAGRAGMQYRDLIPGRVGGRFIASHIRIPDRGPVPDYVHFHAVRFQMIFCKTGWVRLVYEDQGEPFVLHAGDCVLQPPGIRHRVLEASDELEVIELGCPAIHETLADHDLALPTPTLRPAREFAGQRFVRHVAADARWVPWAWPGQGAQNAEGFEMRNTGIDAATSSLASVCVVRTSAGNASDETAATRLAAHDGELLFLFVLTGTLHLSSPSLSEHDLEANDCVTIPAGALASLQAQPDTEFLQVALPAI